MPFLLALVAIISAALFWWWRLRMMSEAARDAAAEAQKLARSVANAPRRLSFRYKAGRDGLTLIEDPREAAAAMLVAIARARGSLLLTDKQEDIIAAEITRHFDFTRAEADDLIAHAVFINNSTPDASQLMKTLSARLVNSNVLGPKDIVDFDAMLVAVSEAEGLPNRDQLALMQVFRDLAGLKT